MNLFLTIPATIEGLEEAAEQILDESSREVVIDAIRRRKRWSKIQREYSRLTEEGMKSEPAMRRLSERYNVSYHTIDKIIYRRNSPYKEVR